MLTPEPVLSDTQILPGPKNATRRGGRAARRARDSRGPEPVGSSSSSVRRVIPAYQLLDEESLISMEQQADWILKEVGVEFRGYDVALALFRDAGADVVGDRVRFDKGHARALCATAPAEYMMHGRDPAKSFILGGDHVVLMPGYGSPFVTDLDQGRRYASLVDFENFVKMTYQSPQGNRMNVTVLVSEARSDCSTLLFCA